MKTLYQLAWILLIYGFFGWCGEVVFATLKTGHFVNRGFLNGPICPIYGFGMMIAVSALSPVKDSTVLLFLASALLCTALEFFTGWILEIIFHTKWWDYSRVPLNIKGYVCPLFSVLWGVACVVLVKFVHPTVEALVGLLPATVGYFVFGFLLAVLLTDFAITLAALAKLPYYFRLLSLLDKHYDTVSEKLGTRLSKNTLLLKEKLNRLAEKKNPVISRLEKAFPALKEAQLHQKLKHLKELLEGKKIDTVVFDMDGTVLNTIDDLADSLNHVLAENGYPTRTTAEVLSFVGNGIGRLVELGLPQGHSQADFDRVFPQFAAYYKEHMNDKTRPYDGIVELMERLKQKGYKLAIVSNKFQAGVTELQEKYYTSVDVALGEQEGIPKKPSPDLVYLALEKLGSGKDTAVYVGDSEVDLATAKNAGLPCISVLWGFRDRETLQKAGATCFAETPEEIEEIIKKL